MPRMLRRQSWTKWRVRRHAQIRSPVQAKNARASVPSSRVQTGAARMLPGRDTRILIWRLLRGFFHKIGHVSLTDRLAMIPVAGAPVSRPVNIWWDEHQVPFIEAETDVDLAVALGIVHGHLRLAQMELMRRASRGRLSELVGRRGLMIDRLVRTFDIARAAPQILAEMPVATRLWLEGFARG